MLQIDETFAGRTVAVTAGEVVELRLAENPTTGYRWQVRSDGRPACRIDEGGPGAVPPSTPTLPGRGGIHVWRIEAVKAGTCEIALDYVRSWQGGGPPGRSFDVRFDVSN